MMNRYIKELLIDNNRVIVPDFGAFIARNTPDVPDGKIIVFNDILKFNDGLLVNHIITKENIDLTLALQKITDYIQEIHGIFSQGRDYPVEGIGKLHLDKRGNVSLLAQAAVLEDTQTEKNSTTETVIPEKNTVTRPITETEIKPEGITTETPVVPEDKHIDIKSGPEITHPVEEKIIIPPPVPVLTTPEQSPPPIPVITPGEVTGPVFTEKEKSIPPPIPAKEPEIKKETTTDKTAEISKPVKDIPVVSDTLKEDPKKEKLKKGKEPVEKKEEPVQAEEPKPDKKIPEQKPKPVKPAEKEKTVATGRKKSPLWLSITIWGVSGILFLSLIFMGSVKFGFIKGVKLFSGDEWISVNEKLHLDLEEYNKKYVDKLALPEISKDDNKKDAFSVSDGSAGSFDAPAGDPPPTENKTEGPADNSGFSEGSSGSFDTPVEAKETKEKDTPASTNLQTSNSSASPGASGKYVLVAGSFKSKDAADRFIVQLKQKGFSSADYAGVSNGMHLTCYGSYNQKNEANAELQKLQQKGVQTWIMNR